jgi:hypothetical protein
MGSALQAKFPDRSEAHRRASGREGGVKEAGACSLMVVGTQQRLRTHTVVRHELIDDGTMV